MELKEFLQKFLPDYETKYVAVMNECTCRGERLTNKAKEYLDEKIVEKYFSKTLQNFADRICDEQRKLCADLYNEEIGYKEPDNYVYNRILEYEQPKIDEL